MNRRKFLKTAVTAGAAVAIAPNRVNPLTFGRSALTQNPRRTLAPVKVSRNRIIREVVGLRPFRSEGFVVNAEQLKDKLLVHNYGHGGAGVTLSWGTASLAIDLARPFIAARNTRRSRPTPLRFAILGCGVSGLSVARLLQRYFLSEGTTVTIYAKALPPDTTSNVAGAWWSPTSVYDSDSITAAFTDQFRRACRIANRAFQELVGPEYGVKWIDTLELMRDEASLQYELTGGNDLYSQIEIHRDPTTYFGFPITRQFSSMLIEPHTYLRALMRDFYNAGGKIVVREFINREQISRLREQIVFNCTGLGARALFKDESLFPVRGQLEVLLPQPEIDYCYLSGGAYMFPRRDGIILGGTWDRDDWSTEPKPRQTTRIIESHQAIMRSGTDFSL